MKILDDVMPEITKRNQDELHELGHAEVGWHAKMFRLCRRN